jgi:hypothetical protein
MASCRPRGSSAAISSAHGEALDERVPGGQDPHAGDGLDPAHRSQPPFELSMVGLDAVLAYCSVWCHAAGRSSSKTQG